MSLLGLDVTVMASFPQMTAAGSNSIAASPRGGAVRNVSVTHFLTWNE